jgi:hypothetical protein
MLATERYSSIAAPLPKAVLTGADGDAPLTPRKNGDSQKWQELIDHPLIDWVLDPSQLDEPGTVTPSKETIQRAIRLARILSNEALPAPVRIVPDAHGGIVFERRQKGLSESIRISADGSVEHCVFLNCRLARRELWPVEFDDDL